MALYTPYLKLLSLTYTQYIVFLALWERDGLTVGEIGQRLLLDNGTLTPLLKRMEEQGWLLRAHSAQDERVVRVHLTGKGRALREQARDIPEKVGRGLRLSKEDASALYALLHRLIDP